MQYPKSQLFEMCLMEAVKQQPVLYNRDCVGYNNKLDIDQAWEKVVLEVNEKVEGINVTHCKLRWRSLRDRYVKQFVKTKNGAIVEPDLSKWPYNAHLNFLRKHLKKRKFGSEDSPTPKKSRRARTAIRKVSESSIPQQHGEEEFVIEEITAAYDNENTCSENSSLAYEQEQDLNVEIDSLDDYDEAAIEEEVAEMEYVPVKTKIEHQQPENPIPEVSNEVIVDPIPAINEQIHNAEYIESANSSLDVDEQPQEFNAEAAAVPAAAFSEDCLNHLLSTVNNLLKEQQRRDAQTSPNEAYFKVLDDLLRKLPPDEMDKAKVGILNFVVNKTKTLQRQNLY